MNHPTLECCWVFVSLLHPQISRTSKGQAYLLSSEFRRRNRKKKKLSLPPEATDSSVMLGTTERQQQQGGGGSEEEEEVGLHQRRESGPTHHPTAPSDELFDVSTTIDPSYIISLIRKLLPNVEPTSTPRAIDSSWSSKFDHMEDDAAPSHGDGEMRLSNDGLKTMDTRNNDFEGSPRLLGTEQPDRSARENAWEESGTVLWDLAANQSHAELMVDNLLLDVLSANLMTSDSARITEISLGIIGNLACHEALMKKITSTKDLMEIVVDQVLSDDTLCLCEVCRLLTLGLQSSECITWAKALQSDHVLARILWIAENTLNPLLIEKSVGLLLAILEDQQEIATFLLPNLVKFGLTSLLVNLLGSEMGKLTSDRIPERYAALDSVLRAVEALSTFDEYSQEICSNKEVVKLATELIKHADKIEVSHCCITAAVLIANILTDAAELAIELAKDLTFLQCLFDLFPFTSDDLEARDALWSIVARLLVRVPETEMNASSLFSYVLLLVKKTDIIEDDLLDYGFDIPSRNHDCSRISEAKKICRSTALKKIINILKQWMDSKGNAESDNSSSENQVDDKDVHRLLECCRKHTGPRV